MNENDNGFIKSQEKEKERKQNILEYQRKFYKNKKIKGLYTRHFRF